jgi:hypothetical protein
MPVPCLVPWSQTLSYPLSLPLSPQLLKLYDEVTDRLAVIVSSTTKAGWLSVVAVAIQRDMVAGVWIRAVSV